MSFTTAGVGAGLADLFNSSVASRSPSMLSSTRGRQFMMVCDVGGSQKAQRYDTYSFLLLDLDRNSYWLSQQPIFRDLFLPPPRRMAFKAMNDALRRRALLSFLELSSRIDGALVTFAVDKIARPRFETSAEIVAELTDTWKPATHERLHWILYLSAFLLSGFASPDQDVLWVIDEDDVAANVSQLTKFTELFGRAVSNQAETTYGHMRCGTTKSDDGSFALEDLAAIPDLAAGAVSELATGMKRFGLGPVARLEQRLPPTTTWKTRTIMPWLSAERGQLHRLTCVIEGKPDHGWRSSLIRINAAFQPAFILNPHR